MILTNTENKYSEINFEKDNFKVLHAEDVSPIMRDNQLLRNDGTNGFSKDRNWRHIATIPLVTWNHLMKTHPELSGKDRDVKDKKIREIINQPEFYWLKTADGNI